jgi:tetratricopeptide (TPR) repeat protein
VEGQDELAKAAFADLVIQGASHEAALDAAVFHLEHEDFGSLEALLNGTKLDDSDPATVLCRAHLLLSRRRPTDALQLLVDYDSEHGLHPAVVVLEAQLRHERGESSAALRRLDAVLECWPESAVARRQRARLLSQAERPAEALEELERLRSLRSATLEDDLRHLQLLRRCGEDERAEREAERLAQLHPLSLRVRSQQRGRWLAPLSVDGGVEEAPVDETEVEKSTSRA